MWILTNQGFISAVQHRDNPNTLIVRARRKEWLEEIFCLDQIHESVGSDYKYRVFVSKLDFANIMYEKILNIDYDNFKNSVKDDDLHDMYVKVWHLGYNMQR